MNILQRFGLTRSLNFILPTVQNALGKRASIPFPPYTRNFNSQILVPPNNEAINVLCNHVIYDRKAFDAVLTGRYFVRTTLNHTSKGFGKRRKGLLVDGKQVTGVVRDLSNIPSITAAAAAAAAVASSKLTNNNNNVDNNCDFDAKKRKRMKWKNSLERGKRLTTKPGDYFHFTMVRNPLQQVISSAYYYNMFPKVDPKYMMKAILDKPTYYTRNRMSNDLGLEPRQFRNLSRVSEFIVEIDRDFDLVLIMEYFDESMVLLRRWLCWDMAEVIYIKRNTANRKPRVIATKEQQTLFLKKLATADSRLYDYFRRTFWRIVSNEGQDFWEEVYHYKYVLLLVKDFCASISTIPPSKAQSKSAKNTTKTKRDASNVRKKRNYDSEKVLFVDESPWSSGFIVNVNHCEIMSASETSLVNLIRKWEYNKE